ncbi:MAG: nucleotidyltransferase domain-containing protein [bacterium]|nr:nucleotidyltransferase domain-containing protein [bacterium]
MSSLARLPLDEIAALYRRYKVRELALFGSQARGDAGPDRDYDFVVSFDPSAKVNLFEMGGLQYDREQLMGRSVDLVRKKGLRNPY